MILEVICIHGTNVRQISKLMSDRLLQIMYGQQFSKNHLRKLLTTPRNFLKSFACKRVSKLKSGTPLAIISRLFQLSSRRGRFKTKIRSLGPVSLRHPNMLTQSIMSIGPVTRTILGSVLSQHGHCSGWHETTIHFGSARSS